MNEIDDRFTFLAIVSILVVWIGVCLWDRAQETTCLEHGHRVVHRHGGWVCKP